MSSLSTYFNKITDRTITPFVFRVSDQPLRLKELLELNRSHKLGLKLEGRIPGVRLSIGKMILAFLTIWNIILLPISFLFHKELAQIDCHLLIFLAIIFTGMFFGTYMMFKEWLIERVARQRVEIAWKNHFPHFAYKTYADRVSDLYMKAIEEDVKSKEMYMFLLNNLIDKKSDSNS